MLLHYRGDLKYRFVFEDKTNVNVNLMSINLKNHGLFDVDVDIDVGRVLEHESVLQVVPNIQKKNFFFLLE